MRFGRFTMETSLSRNLPACAGVLCDTATALRETITEPLVEWAAFVSDATKHIRVSLVSRKQRKGTQLPRDSRTCDWYNQHNTQLAACSLGTAPLVRLRSTSENPTGFSDGKWETLSVDSTRGTGAGIYKKKKRVSLWLLGLARVMTACQYNDDTYMYFAWEQFSSLNTAGSC